ncbi:glycosyltransferase family 4 protein [Thomasclavelia cocleata]|uniref:glycosyltransferase family 4 protein n=1 Tax=Thomasclavelia cocleata TaxID=69824 RepID=UPI0025830892|nr:glycosyltransferase family 4 protein [Thomasclavelia cocleata]
MRVLFLTNIPSPYRVDFFNELGKYCELTVLYERQKADDRLWIVNNKKNYKSIFLKGKSIGNDTALSFEVLKYLNEKYDRIIVGGYSTPTGMLSILYLSLRHIPFYLNCDGGYIKEDSKINYLIKKFFIRKANYWLSTGKETTEYLIHYGAKKEYIYVYPFTSLYKKDILDKPLDKIEKELLKKELNVIDDKIVIFVGQMIYRKGIDVLLEAINYISKDVKFYIVGGKPKKEYINYISEHQLTNVFFFDFMNKELLFKYYQISDLFVLPTREDIWGLVINEAMANGLPIITTDKCVAGKELINDNGYIISVNNSSEVAQRINELINDSSKINIYSNHSIQIIKKYTLENMTREILNILKKG